MLFFLKKENARVLDHAAEICSKALFFPPRRQPRCKPHLHVAFGDAHLGGQQLHLHGVHVLGALEGGLEHGLLFGAEAAGQRQGGGQRVGGGGGGGRHGGGGLHHLVGGG